VVKVQNAPIILVDAHVHLHTCFPIEQVLSAALQNFTQVAARAGNPPPFAACLLLTEMQGEDWFLRHSRTLKNQDHSLSFGAEWSLALTDEAFSLVATHTTGTRLYLLAGRQVVTAERLEVLALLTADLFPDDKPLPETVTAIAQAGGIPVLPWGVGKWVGQRGQLVTQLLQTKGLPRIYLGDNSGRPVGWRRPQNFARVEQQGLPVLPGTDPLPLPSQAARVGSFGFALAGHLDQAYPGTALKQHLQSTPTVQPFGALESPWRFIRNQLALRFSKLA
jgi:hypothetical protein